MSSKAIVHERSLPYISISYHHHLRREGKGQQSQSQIIHTSANLVEGLSRKQFVKLFWRTLTQLSLAPALQLRWHPCVQHICKVTQVCFGKWMSYKAKMFLLLLLSIFFLNFIALHSNLLLMLYMVSMLSMPPQATRLPLGEKADVITHADFRGITCTQT